MNWMQSDGRIEHEIVVLLQLHGTLSRSALAQKSGLARSTITTAMRSLIAKGVAVERDLIRTDGRGRPSRQVSLVPQAGYAIGLDFGFRHVRGVLADLSHQEKAEAEITVRSDYTVQDGVGAARDLVRQLSGHMPAVGTRLLGVGVGIPCPTSPDGVAGRTAMIPKWSGVRVQDILEETLGCDVHVENESRLAARGEALRGVARGVEDFIYIKLHSGVGGALFVGGQCVTGFDGGAGEFGHISLDPSGPICRCGNRGCLETYAGIPALLHQIKPLHPDITFSKLIDLYQAQDPSAQTILHDAADRVGQAAGMLCNAISPKMIVLGGGLSQAGEPLRDIIARRMQAVSIEANRTTQVTFGQLGRSASALGAVSRAFQVFGQNLWRT